MERLAAAAAASPSGAVAYENWEEVYASGGEGRREVHYYLKRRDGGVSDLAVIGKEKSFRHMSYHYVIKNRSLLPMGTSAFRLNSRREVIDWLNSIISDSSLQDPFYPAPSFPDGIDDSEMDVETMKYIQLRKLGHYTKEFSWLGSSWTCKKRRKHYQSFRRNGVNISVHGFVYVLAEEDKRLVAYLEDMYEDSKGNKMVVVRWFHKIDEVGIVLPHNCSDREIFFSLCLQDLSIECIDGLATVLSPQHFEKFLSEARHTLLEPFLCCKQFENDDVRPFDITQIKGYWKQELLRYMNSISPSKDHANSHNPDDILKVEGNVTDTIRIRSKKRLRRLRDHDDYLQSTDIKDSTDAACLDVQNLSDSSIDCKSGSDFCKFEGVGSATILPNKECKQNPSQFLRVGSRIEVLSQDSGMRGCWFRASIIKKHKDKVKVCYEDIRDAFDEANKLQEWILASRVAVHDYLGFRLSGRTTIRPQLEPNKGKVSWVIDVGAAVDVWWHDGWWEGIVIKKESEDRVHVFFPGERKDSVFRCDELRHSQEWLGNGWTHIKARPEIATSISLQFEREVVRKSRDDKSVPVDMSDNKHSSKDNMERIESLLEFGNKENVPAVVPDLSKDNLLAQLRWKSSKKRRRSSGSSVQKLLYDYNYSKSNSGIIPSRACEEFFIPASLKVDHDNCKYMGDSLFSSSVVPPLTSLVMSR